MQVQTKYAIAPFEIYICTTIGEELDHIRLAYRNNILIYCTVDEKHIGHIKTVIKCLLGTGLCLTTEKYQFHIKPVRYLGLDTLTMEYAMVLDEIKIVQNS